jgi:hypothetical protein
MAIGLSDTPYKLEQPQAGKEREKVPASKARSTAEAPGSVAAAMTAASPAADDEQDAGEYVSRTSVFTGANGQMMELEIRTDPATGDVLPYVRRMGGAGKQQQEKQEQQQEKQPAQHVSQEGLSMGPLGQNARDSTNGKFPDGWFFSTL